jgi:hypothetical protein
MSEQPPERNTALPPELNVSINADGRGDIDLYTGATVSAMDSLARAGVTFNDQWKAQLGRITAEEAALSGGSVVGGIISEPFLNNYNLAAPALVAGADGLGPMFDSVALAGRNVVANYLEADGLLAKALRDLNQPWL